MDKIPPRRRWGSNTYSVADEPYRLPQFSIGSYFTYSLIETRSWLPVVRMVSTGAGSLGPLLMWYRSTEECYPLRI